MLVHCVHLPRLPFRKESAQREFDRERLQVRWWEGIDAKQFGLHTLLPYMDDQPNWKPEDGPPYRISQGQVGCLLSHWSLWNCLLWSDRDWHLICEDDIQLMPDFAQRAVDAIAAAPSDWQYLFFGHSCLSVGHRINSHWVAPSRPPFCTHCYCVRASALPTLIATNRICYSHIDIQIAKRSLPHLRYYAADPPLATQLSTEPEHRVRWSTTLE